MCLRDRFLPRVLPDPWRSKDAADVLDRIWPNSILDTIWPVTSHPVGARLRDAAESQPLARLAHCPGPHPQTKFLQPIPVLPLENRAQADQAPV